MSGCLLDALLCDPPKYIYDLTYATSMDRAQHCFSNEVQYDAFMYQAALLFATDIAILLLPLPAILKLKISRGRGLALAIIFGSGQCCIISGRFYSHACTYSNIYLASVACIAPIIRFQTLNFLRKSGNTDATCAYNLEVAVMAGLSPS